MLSLLRLAWRNLWRNRNRTAINLSAVAISSSALMISDALLHGQQGELERKATTVLVGEAQIHHPSFFPDQSIYRTIDGADEIVKAARSEGLSAAPRGIGFGLVSLGPQSGGAQFWGVDPSAEREVGEMPRMLQAGSYLADAPEKKVVLGRLLAKNLNARVGSEVVVVLQAADGSTRSEFFKVAGILSEIGDEVDRRAAVIHLRDFAELFEVPGKVHEIVLSSHGRMPSSALVKRSRALAGPHEVRSWQELLPSIADIISLMGTFGRVATFLIFLAAGLGVLNTMLMSSFERIREFGILKAIGTEPWRIIRDVVLEALVLGAAGGLLGIGLGVPMGLLLQIQGVARPQVMGAAGVTLDTTWHAQLSPSGILVPVILCWVVSVAAAVYPAIKAARVDPIKALTHV